MGAGASYYRIIYNIFSGGTLSLLVVFMWMDPGEVVFSWSSWTALLRLIFFVAAMSCFIGGAKGYDLQNFLGLKQLREKKESVLLSDGHCFSEAGIFGLVRHPWYVGSFLFIWSVFGTYYEKNFAVAIILSIYLIAGTYLEERKIIAEHGDTYRRYRARVSMFFPLKWLLRRCIKVR